MWIQEVKNLLTSSVIISWDINKKKSILSFVKITKMFLKKPVSLKESLPLSDIRVRDLNLSGIFRIN